MRLTSYSNLLWIIALLAALCVAALAQAPPGSTASQNAVVQRTFPTPQQPPAVNGGATETLSSPVTQANSNSGLAESRVETAGIFPDSASLLPVAALVGFSFLLGGIVCGTIKNRP